MATFDTSTYLWEKGQHDWHLEYNAVLDALSTFMGDKGSHASLGAGLTSAETSIATKADQSFATEVTNARGSTASLTARLSTALNNDGTLKASTPTGTNFANTGHTPTHVSGTSFTVVGDQTLVYTANRRVSLTLTSGDVYGTVSSSSYSNPNTTVVLKTSISDSTISAVGIGVVGVGSSGGLPPHSHASDEQGGLIDEIQIASANAMRLADEMQSLTGGASFGMEKGWSDSYQATGGLGHDASGSTDAVHDTSTKSFRGTAGGTLNADWGYTADSEVDHMEFTNAISEGGGTTSQIAVTNGSPNVSLTSGSFPENCLNAKIYISAAWYQIQTRTSNTALVLSSNVSATTGSYDYQIRFSEISSGKVQLNSYSVAGSPTVTEDATTGWSSGQYANSVRGPANGVDGSGEAMMFQEFKLQQAGDIYSVSWMNIKEGSLTDNFVTAIYASTTPTAQGGWPVITGTANSPVNGVYSSNLGYKETAASGIATSLTETEHVFGSAITGLTQNNFYFAVASRSGGRDTTNLVGQGNAITGSPLGYTAKSGYTSGSATTSNMNTSTAWTGVGTNNYWFKLKQNVLVNNSVITEPVAIGPNFTNGLKSATSWGDLNQVSVTQSEETGGHTISANGDATQVTSDTLLGTATFTKTAHNSVYKNFGKSDDGQWQVGPNWPAPSSHTLGSITCRIRKNAAHSDNVFLKVYAADSDAQDPPGVPTGSLLATSDVVAASTLVQGGDGSEIVFNFSGADQISMTSGNNYCALLTRSGSDDGSGYSWVMRNANYDVGHGYVIDTGGPDSVIGSNYGGESQDGTVIVREPSSTISPKFSSTAMAKFDGTGDYISMADSDDWLITSSGDYTIDFWVNHKTLSASRAIFGQRVDNDNKHVLITTVTSGDGEWFWSLNTGGTGHFLIETTGADMVVGTWYHIACVVSGGGSTATLYVNGVSKGTTSLSGTPTNISAVMAIGDDPSGGYNPFDGWLDEMRFSNTARWTADFSSSLPSSTYTTDANTKALLHFNNGGTANFVDNSFDPDGPWHYFIFVGDGATDFTHSSVVITTWNDTGSCWKPVATYDSAWKYNSDSNNTTASNYVTATENTMLTAIAQGVSSNSALQCTKTQAEAITDSEFEQTGGWQSGTHSKIGMGTVLKSSSSTSNTSVDLQRLSYDSERASMSLQSPAYDPSFSPTQSYLWTRSEYSTSDGAPLYYVSRNGGTNWEQVTMTQSGPNLTGNVRMLYGTHTFTTGASSQDLRMKVVTTQGKNQFVHSIGLQARS